MAIKKALFLLWLISLTISGLTNAHQAATGISDGITDTEWEAD